METDHIEILDLIDPVKAHVPFCPTPVVEDAMRRAIQDFFDDTGVWRDSLAPFTVEKDRHTYLLTPPLDAVIQRIDRLDHDDTARPVRWRFDPPRQIHFEALPKEGESVAAVAQLNLSLNAQSVPCDHANRYARYWVDGALWHLQQQPGTDWYAPEQADYHRSLFRRSIARARMDDNRNRSGGQLRVRPNRFV